MCLLAFIPLNISNEEEMWDGPRFSVSVKNWVKKLILKILSHSDVRRLVKVLNMGVL
jgi:hypothetical protein